MNAHAIMPTDTKGLPYTPAKPRPWLTEAIRANFAGQFDCAPAEVEYRLDARDLMDAYIAERREDEEPFGYSRQRSRYARVERMMNDERTW